MSSQIVTYLTDQRLQMRNSQYIRAMTWGADWQQVRISVRISMYAPRNAAALGCYGNFAFGMCSGASAAFGNATTDAFVGLWTGHPWRTNSQYLYNASPSAFYADHWYDMAFLKKEGTTHTQTAIMADTTSNNYASKETSRSLMMLQITKGNPNYSFQKWSMELAEAAADSTAELQIEQLIAAIPDASLFNTNTPIDIAKPTLVPDHINMYWNNQVWPMEISDLYLVKNS